MGAVVDPIDGSGVRAAAAFLQAELNPRLGVDGWERAIRTSFDTTAPHHGLMLRQGDEVVAVLLTFFSQRMIDGRPEPFCNLGAWCVRPDQRFQGLRLLRAALALPGYHFTDLSPSGAVVPLNEKLGFGHLDTTSSLLPCLPLPVRAVALTAPAQISAALHGADGQIYDDHREAEAAHHVLLRDDDGECYVMYRLDRRRDIPAFASLLHVSDPATFQRMSTALGAHVLREHRTLALLLEHRLVGRRPGAIALRRSRPKMYRSTLPAAAIDNLYSELCAVPW